MCKNHDFVDSAVKAEYTFIRGRLYFYYKHMSYVADNQYIGINAAWHRLNFLSGGGSVMQYEIRIYRVAERTRLANQNGEMTINYSCKPGEVWHQHIYNPSY